MIRAIYRKNENELFKIRALKCVAITENPSLFNGTYIQIYDLDESKFESLRKLNRIPKKEFNKVFKRLSKLAKNL
ncbi:hypothetical protein MYP_686 [Sporocytophaga myxococcoides]|uniref:Uncharacterized protein n=1 Tax=Sporocytophaga myxococcoides TaxID=153721 RepID=A0A098LAJ1_9BACT|nr:hypothetical protein [Sporocytophaga myxococcoides]GAL83459.1 hypothetical protein MYP_686 [Sporocytophaga myxococcoides]